MLHCIPFKSYYSHIKTVDDDAQHCKYGCKLYKKGILLAVTVEKQAHRKKYESYHFSEVPVTHRSVKEAPPFFVNEYKHVEEKVGKHGHCAYLGKRINNPVVSTVIIFGDLVGEDLVAD